MADAKIKDLKWLLDKLGDSKVKSINFEHDDDWYVYEYDVLIVDINDAINGQTKYLWLLGSVIDHFKNYSLYLKDIEALSVDPYLTGEQVKLWYKQAWKVFQDKENKELRHLLNMEEAIKETLQNFLNKRYITEDDYYRLAPRGSQPGILYGLAKIHKTIVGNCPPCWPILSAINTPTYKIAKFLRIFCEIFRFFVKFSDFGQNFSFLSMFFLGRSFCQD